MLLINEPVQIFYAADGTPLEAGRIYVGTAGLDAIANPITLYWDSALTIPAAQPVRTLGGRPVYQGQAGNLYTSANSYSITVQDRNAVPIITNAAGYSFVTSDDLNNLESELAAPTGAGIVGFSQSETYSDGTVGARLQEIISLGDAPYINAASDNIAIDQAISKAASFSNGGVVRLPPNRLFEITEREVPDRVYIDAGQASIRALSTTPGLFKCVGGLSGISGGFWLNPSGYATRAITVDKPIDNTVLSIKGGYFSEFTNALEVAGGDCIFITDNIGVSNGVALLVTNEFLNSSFADNYILGGNGVSIQKITQGAEGCDISDNWILPATGGTFGINIQTALHVEIRGNIIDQLTTGNAIELDGITNPVSAVTIQGNWLGSQVGSNGNYGIYGYGAITELDIQNNTFAGFDQAGVYLNGSAPNVMKRITVSDNTYLSTFTSVRDIQLAYIDGIRICGEKFSGAASLVEGAGVIGRVDFCDWAMSVKPSAGIGQTLKYGKQVRGLVLDNRGTATIAQTTKVIQIAHGLAYTPANIDFRVIPSSLATNAVGEIYVDTIDATNASIKSRNDPGAGGAPVAWAVDMTR